MICGLLGVLLFRVMDRRAANPLLPAPLLANPSVITQVPVQLLLYVSHGLGQPAPVEGVPVLTADGWTVEERALIEVTFEEAEITSRPGRRSS